MAARAVLVALIIGDAGLRSALTARLALHGVDLMTAATIDAAGRRKPGEPSILVVDAAGIERERGDWLETLVLENRWQRILVLAADAPAAPTGRNELIHVNMDSVYDAITQTIEELREIEGVVSLHR